MLFAVSTAATVAGSLSMPGMADIAMPGGWTMSMAWMPMCGQTWVEVAATFTGMWAAMMMAMMLPSLVPMLLRYERELGTRGEARRGPLMASAAAGYFCIWVALGPLVFALGAALAQAILQMPSLANAVPMAQAVVVLLAGVFQFTSRKAHHLACCREAARDALELPANAATAWRFGVHLGLHCICACAGLTAILLVIGVMDWRAMVMVTAAITLERLMPDGERMARAVGAGAAVVGLCLLGRVVGFA